MSRRNQPDFKAIFDERYGGSPKKVAYDVRSDSNRLHDLVFLNSFVHDARFRRRDLRLRGSRLTIPIERECWELGPVKVGTVGVLYTARARLSLSPIHDLAWHFDHDREFETDSELVIIGVELRVRTCETLDVCIRGDDWRLTMVADDDPLSMRLLNVRLRDLEVPHLPA